MQLNFQFLEKKRTFCREEKERFVLDGYLMKHYLIVLHCITKLMLFILINLVKKCYCNVIKMTRSIFLKIAFLSNCQNVFN